MKRNGKLLALIMAVAMVMTMLVIPVSAAADNPADSDYVAPSGVNLFDLWGYSWDYDKSDTNKLTTLYGTAKTLNFTGRMPNATNEFLH